MTARVKNSITPRDAIKVEQQSFASNKKKLIETATQKISQKSQSTHPKFGHKTARTQEAKTQYL